MTDSTVEDIPFWGFVRHVGASLQSSHSVIAASLPESSLRALVQRNFEKHLVYLANAYRLENMFEADTPEGQYEEFEMLCSSGAVWSSLQRLFPDLIGKWETGLRELERNCVEIYRNFARDRAQIAAANNVAPATLHIRSLQPLGDLHAGRAVMRVDCGPDLRLFHKPRSAANDQALQDVVSVLNAPSAEPSSDEWLPLQRPRILDRGSYHWAEEIHHQPVEAESLRSYHHRAGQLIAVAHLLSLTDLHHENIIATSTEPMVIDAETLLSTTIRQIGASDHATRRAITATAQSCMAMGLIPLGTKFQELGGDVCGLSATRLRVPARQLVNLGRSDIHFEKSIVEVPPERNLPSVESGGQVFSVLPDDYLDDLLSGLRAGYLRCRSRRCDIAATLIRHAPNLQVRVLARLTSDYSMVQAGLERIGGESRNQVIRVLHQHSNGLDPRVIDSEERQLLAGHIPFFSASADSRTIVDPDQHPVAELQQTPLETALDRLERASEESQRFEEGLVRLAFEGLEDYRVDPTPAQQERWKRRRVMSLSECARLVLERIEREALRGDDGSVNWVTLAVDDHDQATLEPLVGGLYKGCAGLSIILLELSRVADREPPIALLRTLYRQISDELRLSLNEGEAQGSLSYYNGAAGRLHALQRIGAWTNDDSSLLRDSLLDKALEQSHKDDAFDVIDGAAGLLIALGRRGVDARCRELCAVLGDGLLSRSRTDGDTTWWPNRMLDGQGNASFAHDSGGIATAMLHTFVLTGEDRYLEAWRGGWQHENLFRQGETWIDRRRGDDSPSAYWCHGLVGLALERHLWFGLLPDSCSDEREQIQRELGLLIEQLRAALPEQENASLCHGTAGQALVIAQLRPELSSEARSALQLASRSLTRWFEPSWDNVPMDLGLLTSPLGLVVADGLIADRRFHHSPLLPGLLTPEECV